MGIDASTMIEILTVLGVFELLKRGSLKAFEYIKHRTYGMKYLSKLYSDTFDSMSRIYNTTGVNAVALVRCKNGGKLLKNDTDITFESFVPNIHEKSHDLTETVRSLKPTFDLLQKLRESFIGLSFGSVDGLPPAYFVPVIDRGKDFIFLLVTVNDGLAVADRQGIEQQLLRVSKELARIVR